MSDRDTPSRPTVLEFLPSYSCFLFSLIQSPDAIIAVTSLARCRLRKHLYSSDSHFLQGCLQIRHPLARTNECPQPVCMLHSSVESLSTIRRKDVRCITAENDVFVEKAIGDTGLDLIACKARNL